MDKRTKLQESLDLRTKISQVFPTDYDINEEVKLMRRGSELRERYTKKELELGAIAFTLGMKRTRVITLENVEKLIIQLDK